MKIPQPEMNVHDLCRDYIASQWDGDTKHISPTMVALSLLEKFSNIESTDATIVYHCFLQFKEIARKQLKFCFKQEEEIIEQLDMFGRKLQARYPTRNDDGDAYTRLDDLSDAEILEQIARLERESRAKQQHATALRAYRARRNFPPANKAA